MLPVLLVLAGLLLTLRLRRRGVLAEAWLRGTPRRLAAFSWLDLLAVAVLFLLGGNAAAGLAGTLPAGVPTAVEQLVMQAGAFGLPALWVLLRAAWMQRGLRRLGVFWRGKHLGLTLKSAPAAWLLASAALLLAAGINHLAGRETPAVQHELLGVLQRDGGWLTLAAVVVSAVVIAPIAEELITRGLLQTLLVRTLGDWSRWLAVVLASAFFTSLHIPGVPVQALPGIFVLGLVFGALYERTGSLLPGVLVHAAFNGLNVGLVAAGVAG